MTLIIKFGVAVPDILVNSILNYCCMFAFHNSIMVPNACTHHVHGILIYNHLHNGYMASTNNNSWSISAHMFKKLLDAHFWTHHQKLALLILDLCKTHPFWMKGAPVKKTTPLQGWRPISSSWNRPNQFQVSIVVSIVKSSQNNHSDAITIVSPHLHFRNGQVRAITTNPCPRICGIYITSSIRKVKIQWTIS